MSGRVRSLELKYVMMTFMDEHSDSILFAGAGAERMTGWWSTLLLALGLVLAVSGESYLYTVQLDTGFHGPRLKILVPLE